MKVMITGGFGYLGGRLAQFLAQRSGVEILLGSRRHTEPPQWLPQAQTIVTQWKLLNDLEAICSGVDVVMHLAGMSAQDCAADPVAALEFNGVATARLLQAAVRQKVKRFVYASSAHVYGSPLTGTVTEETCPVSLHPYAISNRAGEDAVRSAHKNAEIEGVVIRLSNAFGPPAHKGAACWNLLVNNLCLQAVSANKIVLRSFGLQRRDFMPLTDVCRAFDHLAFLPASRLRTGLFNVGARWAPTVWEMGQLVQEACLRVMGRHLSLERGPRRAEDMTGEFDFCISVLLESGFVPVANFRDEIDSLLRFCQQSGPLGNTDAPTC